MKKENPSAARSPENATEIREHLAIERALLSWVGIGVGLVSVGFVVERAGALVAQDRRSISRGSFTASPFMCLLVVAVV